MLSHSETWEALGQNTNVSWKFMCIILFNPLFLESECFESFHCTEGEAEAALR